VPLFLLAAVLVVCVWAVLACFEGLRIYYAEDYMPFGHLLLGIIGISMGIQCIFTGFVLISIKSMNTRLARQRGNSN
jgi:hypothetical protein